MGFFSGQTTCPLCGSDQAKKSLFKVKCGTPGCANYDDSVISSSSASSPPMRPRSDGKCTIQYKNFKGELKTFIVDPTCIKKRRAHVGVKLDPEGIWITLKPSSIINFQEIKSYLQG